ncbi:MAG: TlpA family protein disulfide reductase [Chitinophagaceae bacterium]|nr:TlpA family protein disulfide reductase [Chitinophagaceae bacterium]
MKIYFSKSILILLLVLLHFLTNTTLAQHSMCIEVTFNGFKQVSDVQLRIHEPTIYPPNTDTVSLKLINKRILYTRSIQNLAVHAQLTWRYGNQKGYRYFLLHEGKNTVDIGIINGKIQFRKNQSSIDSLQKQFDKLQGKTIQPTMLNQRLKLTAENPANFASLLELAYISRFVHIIPADSIEVMLSRLDNSLQQTPLGLELKAAIERRRLTFKNSQFPSVLLENESGQMVDIRSFPNQYFLIAFGATWCGPCKELLPKVKAIANKYQAQDLNVIYINLDDNREKWRRMINDYGISNWIHLTDTVKMNKSPITKQFSIAAIPQYMLVDSSWNILYNSMQELDVDLDKVGGILKYALRK